MGASRKKLAYGSVVEFACSQLRDMIVRRELPPGQWLKLNDLAQRLDTSVTPVREALRILQAEGLVLIDPRRGARVAELSVADFQEIDRMVLALALQACEWVAEDFTRVPLDEMRRTLCELEDAENRRDVSRRRALVREFRFLLYTATGKKHLLRVLSSLYDMATHYQRMFSEDFELAPKRMNFYREICLACETRDLPKLLQTFRDLHALASKSVIGRFQVKVSEIDQG